MSKKLSRNVIKQYINEYLKAYGAFTNAPAETSPQGDTNNFWIAFFTQEKGIYSGVSKYHGKYYDFTIDFANKDFSVGGITGKKLANSASTLNLVFGYDALKAATDPACVKLYKLGSVLGNANPNDNSFTFGGTDREETNIGRGIMRAIKLWPIAELCTEATWFQYSHRPWHDGLVDLMNDMQRRANKKDKHTLAAATALSKKRVKGFLRLRSPEKAKNLMHTGEDTLDLLDQVRDIAEQVDRERGYHTADSWTNSVVSSLSANSYRSSKWYYDQTMERLTIYYSTAVRKVDIVKHLFTYLYGSCYHQQALSFDAALNLLDDYYGSIDKVGERHPVKYPRYLATAHDIAALNATTVADKSNNLGVYKNYCNNKQLEGTIGKWAFIVGQTPTEIANEATQQSNCVAGYIGSVAEGNTLIMFMRRLKDINTSVVTFEVDVKNKKVIQAYNSYNTKLEPEMAAALDSWARTVGFEVSDRMVVAINPEDRGKGRKGKLQECNFHDDSVVEELERTLAGYDVKKEKLVSTKIVAA